MIYKGRYKVTQVYKGVYHQGIDLVGLDSKTIYVPIDGVIIRANTDTYYDGGMGNYVKLQDSLGRYHLFAHLSEFKVHIGQVAPKGTPIGVEGDTGHSFGSHCHYEMRDNLYSSSFLDVAQIMGIPNEIGTYISSNKDLVQVKYGFNDETMRHLDDYDYPNDLFLMMLKPSNEQHYQLNTINYILKYRFGIEVFNKL